MSAERLVRSVAALSRTVTEPFTARQLLAQLVDLAADLDADGAGITVVEADSLDFVHATGHAFRQLECLQADRGRGPCQLALRTQREVAIADVYAHPETAWPDYVEAATAAGVRSVLAVPLVSRQRCWGVLDLYRQHAGEWEPGLLAAARLLADVAVSYLVMAADRDQARAAQRELAHRSLHDDLTGLPNRTLLFDRLTHALTAATRHGHVVALFFIDLDGFKQVNDVHGHFAGDRVLAAVARHMAASVRGDDTLARLAGDEFVLVCEQLPQHADDDLEAQLREVTDRLHAALATPVQLGEVELTVSASIGSALSDEASTADTLLATADAAMYRAKHGARSSLPQ